MDGYRTFGLIAMACLLAICWVGCGSEDQTVAPERVAVAKYRSSLVKNARALADWTAQMKHEIAAEELGGARFSYAMARVQYGQIEPVAQTFKSLDARINAHADDVSSKNFGGFHRIEKALFPEETTENVADSMGQLVADVEALQSKLKNVPLRPRKLAIDARRMLDEVSHIKLTGSEEPYSHIDLVDISANIEGAEAAFIAVKPWITEQRGEELVEQVRTRFAATFAALRSLGTPAYKVEQTEPNSAGTMFDIYSELPEGFEHHIDKPIEALAEVLAQVPPHIQ